MPSGAVQRAKSEHLDDMMNSIESSRPTATARLHGGRRIPASTTGQVTTRRITFEPVTGPRLARARTRHLTE